MAVFSAQALQQRGSLGFDHQWSLKVFLFKTIQDKVNCSHLTT